jgi:hypothetical protein
MAEGLLPPWRAMGGAVVVVLGGMLLTFIWIRRRNAVPPEAQSERILRRQIDEYQKRERLLLIMFSLIALLWCIGPVNIGRSMANSHLPQNMASLAAFMRWFMPAVFVCCTFLTALILSFGQGFAGKRAHVLNDELTRALRARATRIGYLIAFPGLGAAYLVALYRPEWSTLVLPPVIAAAIALPSLYFVFVEWRAGCNSESAGRDET